MTNQTIPPCPVCGTVPKLDSYKRVILTGECRLHILNNGVWCKKKLVLDVGGWAWYCNQAIGHACRELGIETVEQLKARLEPDPRVAVLEPIQALLDEWPKYRDSVLGRKDDPPCSVCGGELDTGWECNACGHDMQMEVCPDIKLWGQITRFIAAQRGEVAND